MSIKQISLAASVLVILAVGACSVLKSDDAEKEVRLFVTSFQNTLAMTDAEILKQFETQQSSQAILSAIAVLQNKDLKFIQCSPAWSQAQVIIDDGGIRVVLPVSLTSREVKFQFSRETTLVMWLKQSGDSFVITQFDGEDFYNSYVSLKNEMEWSVSEQEQMESRRPIIARARELQEQYDSVVWFTQTQDSTYFYVVSGNWSEDGVATSGAGSHKMGLVNFEGKEIIPVEYDLIGTIGFSFDNVVEISRDGKAGLVNLATRLRLEPTYDMIIPYGDGDALALVKLDTAYGWISEAFEYQAGFPSEAAERFVRSYSFIPDQMKISSSDQYLCQIPNEERVGYGVVIPPSYYTANGMFTPIVRDLVVDGIAINAFTEYIETKKTFFEGVTENVNALITTIRERYLEGREEFYTQNKLVFFNEKQEPIASTDQLWGPGEFELRRVGDLIEVKSYRDVDSYYYYEGDSEDDLDYNLPMYTYFSLDGEASLSQLESSRTYPFTQFVKMDSSYITGSFIRYNSETGSTETTTFLSNTTLAEIRNEILAIHGYAFPDPKLVERYQNYSWYSPEYNDLAEIESHMTEVDLHNMKFLEKILGPVPQGAAM